MLKSNASTKWSQFGRGGRGRDATFPSAPLHVSKDAQANTTIDETATRLVTFSSQNREQLPERPSTSAGPASATAKRRNAEKRETKDDLYYNPLASHGKGTTFYNFPLPGSLPTPATSPKDIAPPTPRKSSSTRPPTPESIEAVSTPAITTMEVPQAEIGMALGSPAHPPTTWHQNTYSIVDVHAVSPSPDHMDGLADEWSNSPRAVKQKNKGWKLFGGLFGGKKLAPSPAFYQLQPEGATRTTVEAVGILSETPASSEAKPVKPRGRGRSVSERMGKKDKPDLKRTETAPMNFDFTITNAPRVYPTAPEITLEGRALVDHSSKPMQQKGTSLLDVDIPDVHMERYSIMFGSVLGKPSTNSSSLLARRQATLEKLKTVNEALAAKEQELNEKAKQLKVRRATSPQPRYSQSPAFSLFPNTPSRRDQSPSRHRNSSTLQRSNTSPAALSPSRPSFAPGSGNVAHAIIMSPESEDLSPRKSAPSQSSKSKRGEQKAAEPAVSPSKQWTLDESHLMLDSPDSMSINDEDIYDPAPFPMKPKLSEPQWQMINPTHTHVPAASISGSATSSSTTSSENSNSTAASSVSTPQSAGSVISRPLNIASPPLSSSSRSRAIGPTLAQREIPKPRSKSATRIANASATQSSDPEHGHKHDNHSEDEQEARLKTAADVSIARQISVSRQQRQLLVPIKSAGSVRKVERTIAGKKFPVSGGLGATTISVAHVSSPLGAVAVAAQAERERAGSPLVERGEKERLLLKTRLEDTGRFVEGRKPSTPTLVIVGDDVKAREDRWAGATATLKSKGGSIAERRRMKGRDARGLTPVAGEIRGRLTTASAVRGTGYADPQHRKSERVVVEQIGESS